MPRKPTLPPPLHIEGLSDGKGPEGPQEFVDDFTGEVLPIVQPPAPRRIPPSAKVLIEAERERAKQALPQPNIRIKYHPDGRLTAHKREQTELVPKGKRKFAELDGKAVLMPLPPWRRI